MKKDVYRELLELLRRLREATIAYNLRHSRDDAIMIQAFVPMTPLPENERIL